MTHQNPWARTYSGGVFHPLAPRCHEIRLEDIINPLANTVRYNGGTRYGVHYSVAEHSVLIARLLRAQFPDDPVLALQGLMHDAAEAYVGDMVRPVKSMVPAFREIEDRVTAVIFERYNIPYRWPAIVDEFDARICLDEEAQALHPGARRFEIEGGPLGLALEFWDRETARENFLIEFSELTTAAREIRLAAYEGAGNG